MTDPTNAGSLSDLLEGDIRTPGYMTLPVCNYGFALDNWKQHGDKPDGVTGWPCATWPSPDKCQISSFEDATSEASPLRSDCETLIKNWEGTQKSWTVYTTGLKHKTLDTNGTCAFGAQARNTHGSVKFQVGAQDLVDLVSESMNRFQGGGGQDWRGGRGHLQGECQ